ncbi:unnamed protein product [Brassica napus]|uniref:(rape) hypothetical protein n=1 Tax=Brassica napus TaxID=3708 RepID=A0A816IWZ7_BRANA|nr:unnamed protein product [Brassica napus]
MRRFSDQTPFLEVKETINPIPSEVFMDTNTHLQNIVDETQTIQKIWSTYGLKEAKRWCQCFGWIRQPLLYIVHLVDRKLLGRDSQPGGHAWSWSG